MIKWLIIGIFSVFIASVAQIFLKKSSNLYREGIKQYLNIYILIGYSMFLSSVILNMYILKKGINLKYMPILEATGYVFVPILSYIFYKERFKNKVLGIFLIIVGIVIFNLWVRR